MSSARSIGDVLSFRRFGSHDFFDSFLRYLRKVGVRGCFWFYSIDCARQKRVKDNIVCESSVRLMNTISTPCTLGFRRFGVSRSFWQHFQKVRLDFFFFIFLESTRVSNTLDPGRHLSRLGVCLGGSSGVHLIFLLIS